MARKAFKVYQKNNWGGRRDGSGRKPGVPNKNTGEIREVAQQYGPAVITRLAELAALTPGTPADSHAVQVAAMKELLDRGYGRATQPIAGDAEAPPLAIDFRWADATPAQAPESEPISNVGDIDVVFAADACCATIVKEIENL